MFFTPSFNQRVPNLAHMIWYARLHFRGSQMRPLLCTTQPLFRVDFDVMVYYNKQSFNLNNRFENHNTVCMDLQNRDRQGFEYANL